MILSKNRLVPLCMSLLIRASRVLSLVSSTSSRHSCTLRSKVSMSLSSTSALTAASGASESISSTVPSTPSLAPGDILFGRFIIPQASIFYSSSSTTSATTTRSYAFVNLRPIVPGHVLVVPERIVAEMRDLTEPEYLGV
jgi:hypothetical protein